MIGLKCSDISADKQHDLYMRCVGTLRQFAFDEACRHLEVAVLIKRNAGMNDMRKL